MEEEIRRQNVFKNKNYCLVFLGALVSNIASLFYSFAVSFYILKITDNNALLQGIYLAVGGITFGIVTLFGGVISDRFNKAKIMYICDFIKGIVIIGFTLLLIFVIKSVNAKIVSLFIVSIISNAIAGIFSPASSALLPIIVKEDEYQQAQSYFSILSSFQSIVGVILAGVLYTLIPINILFLIVGIFYIGSAVSEMFIKYETSYERKEDKLTARIVFSDIKEGFKYIASIKAILALMICILFINFFFSPVFDNFMPYFISTDVASSNYMFSDKIAPEMWSSFGSVAFGIGSLIMGIVLSSIEPKEKSNPTIKWSLVLMAIVMGAFTLFYALFITNIININALLIIDIIMLLLIGLLIVLVNVPTSTALMRLVDKDKMGKVSSVLNIGSQGLIPLSMFLGGIAINYFSSIGLLIICASGFFIVAMIVFFNKPIKAI